MLTLNRWHRFSLLLHSSSDFERITLHDGFVAVALQRDLQCYGKLLNAVAHFP
jgi:hypothetical protein